MAVPVLDATSSTTGGTATVTWSHTCSGTNRKLVVLVAYWDGTIATTGVTYNGVALTLVGSVLNATGNDRASVWELLAPATGANNIVVTYGATVSASNLGAISYTNASQTASAAATTATGGAGTQPTLTVASDTNSVIVAAAADGGGAIMTAGTGATLIYGTNFAGEGGAGERKDGVASTTVAFASATGTWAEAAASIAGLASSLNIGLDTFTFFPGAGPLVGMRAVAAFTADPGDTSTTSANAFSQTFAAGLSFAGAIGKGVGKTLSGGLSFTGANRRGTSKTVGGGLSFTGAQSKGTGKSLSGGLSFTGGIGRGVGKSLSAVLSFTGSQFRGVGKGIAGVLSFTGSVRKGIAKSLSGTISFSGAFAAAKNAGGTAYTLTLNAILSFTGAQSRGTGKGLGGGLSFSGSTNRGISKVVACVLSFTGALGRGRFVTFVANLSFAGAVTAVKSTATSSARELILVGSKLKKRITDFLYVDTEK